MRHKELKIVTYNIHLSGNPQAVAKNIKRLAYHGANVFCLQEVTKRKNREFIGDVILKHLGQGWKAEYFISPKPKGLLLQYGLCIIWQTHKLIPHKFTLSFLPRLKHFKTTKKFLEDKRGAIIASFRLGNKHIRISNVHLDWQGGFMQRFRQIHHLAAYLKKESPAHFEIVCGDFNTIGLINPYKQVQKILDLLGKHFTDAMPKRRNTTIYFEQLDHFFVKGFKIKHAHVFKWPGSDHYPIMLTVEYS